MTATVDPAANQMARFVVMYDTSSDVDAFERHYNDVHIPLAKQYPGLRRYTRSHEPAVVIGEPCYSSTRSDRGRRLCERVPASSIVAEAGPGVVGGVGTTPSRVAVLSSRRDIASAGGAESRPVHRRD